MLWTLQGGAQSLKGAHVHRVAADMLAVLQFCVQRPGRKKKCHSLGRDNDMDPQGERAVVAPGGPGEMRDVLAAPPSSGMAGGQGSHPA